MIPSELECSKIKKMPNIPGLEAKSSEILEYVKQKQLGCKYRSPVDFVNTTTTTTNNNNNNIVQVRNSRLKSLLSWQAIFVVETQTVQSTNI